MTTASEEILERYKRTVTETDSFGRVITVGLLRPAKELAVLRMIDTTERTNQVTYLALASVRQIDGNTYPTSQLNQLDAIMNLLDREGLEALGTAYGKLRENEGSSNTPDEAKAAAKN